MSPAHALGCEHLCGLCAAIEVGDIPSCGLCGGCESRIADGRCFDCVPAQRRTLWWNTRRRASVVAPWVVFSPVVVVVFVLVFLCLGIVALQASVTDRLDRIRKPRSPVTPSGS